MILVTGTILAREHAFDAVLASCLEHVERSRKEPGCISHDVHVDCQNPLRLFFFEQWADEAALRTHFAVEGSRAFVKSLKGRADGINSSTPNTGHLAMKSRTGVNRQNG